jgi:GT2 family glycosyltransferase
VALPTLSIVIVNWNSGALLRECLRSITPAAAALRGRCALQQVVVVDNASVDGSADGLPGITVEGRPPRLLRNAVNVGFAAACNQGAAQLDDDFVLFLNPDTRLFAASLSVPVAHLLEPAHARTGVVGIALVDAGGAVARSCARFPRARHFLAQALGLDRRWPRLGQTMREWDHGATRVVDQLIGAFFLVRRKPFAALGGFDETFFVYFEEVDLSLRLRDAGWTSVFVPDARAYHRGGGSTDRVPGRRLFYSLRSRLQYGRKHFGLAERALLGAVTWLLEPLGRGVFLLGSGRAGELRDLVEGYRLLLRHGLGPEAGAAASARRAAR